MSAGQSCENGKLVIGLGTVPERESWNTIVYDELDETGYSGFSRNFNSLEVRDEEIQNLGRILEKDSEGYSRVDIVVEPDRYSSALEAVPESDRFNVQYSLL